MNRRGFIGGLTGFLAAPAIVRAASLMPVSVAVRPWPSYAGYDVMNLTVSAIYEVTGLFDILDRRQILDFSGRARAISIERRYAS
jgi:hypothetical protein